MIKTILFDLDGTLLPMDQEIFTKEYLTALSTKMSNYGYKADELVKCIWAGTESMIKNDGMLSNEEAFWMTFDKFYENKSKEDMDKFDDFYLNEFNLISDSCPKNDDIVPIVKEIKSMGFNIALATNPIFPKEATLARIKWAGLDADDFDIITTYENFHFCKPNPLYFVEVLAKLGARADECLMVGNSVEEDMIAGEIGMKTFLVSDCLINEKEVDINQFENGNFADLLEFVKHIND